MSPPRVVVLAGPNGAGKSTAAAAILQGALGVQAFVNADQIAVGLSGFAPDSTAFEAGRIMLERLNALASQRANFAFETTLASRTFAPWISRLLQNGYEFHLIFLWLSSPEGACARVADRVRRGGHSVPDETIRRLYYAGIRNFFDLYQPLATTWGIFDNGGDVSMVIAEGSGTQVERVRDRRTWSRIKQMAHYGKH